MGYAKTLAGAQQRPNIVGTTQIMGDNDKVSLDHYLSSVAIYGSEK